MGRTLLGIDIGGSGIKGALVDVAAGRLATGRVRIDTPSPATPEACADVARRVAAEVGGDGPFGCTVPGIVRHGVVWSAANIDGSWIGVDAVGLLADAIGRPVTVLNDADAAGIAEMRVGAGRGRDGTVVLLTFGTGIGSAVFRDGTLVPNTELGHLEFRGDEAERHVSGRLLNQLEREEWIARANAFLRHVAFVLGPDLVIFGGGISKEWADFADHLTVDVEVVPAELRNNAGIVGAAMAAADAYPA